MNRKKLFLSLFIFLSACSFDSTKNDKSKDDLKAPMRDAYKVSSKLFSYVWSPNLFMQDSNSKEISFLLTSLIDDFHSIDKFGSKKTDPSFAIALNAQQRLLTDAHQRFNEGNKEYSWWKLKSLTHNCAACHSRFSSRVDFLGSYAAGNDTSFEAKLASSEFLIASRQFSKASNELISVAESVSSLAGGSTYALQALRLWLMLEVRVKESFHGAASELSRIVDSGNLNQEQKSLISSWIVDLQSIQTLDKPSKSSDKFDQVKLLLGFDNNNLFEPRTIFQDDIDLVKTIRASALMHSLSFDSLSEVEKADNLLFLGISYQRSTIPSFKDLSSLYFEQCIRQFPNTPQSKVAFQLFESDFHLLHTGSGGENVASDELEFLNELRKLSSE